MRNFFATTIHIAALNTMSLPSLSQLQLCRMPQALERWTTKLMLRIFSTVSCSRRTAAPPLPRPRISSPLTSKESNKVSPIIVWFSEKFVIPAEALLGLPAGLYMTHPEILLLRRKQSERRQKLRFRSVWISRLGLWHRRCW